MRVCVYIIKNNVLESFQDSQKRRVLPSRNSSWRLSRDIVETVIFQGRLFVYHERGSVLLSPLKLQCSRKQWSLSILRSCITYVVAHTYVVVIALLKRATLYLDKMKNGRERVRKGTKKRGATRHKEDRLYDIVFLESEQVSRLRRFDGEIC